MMHIVENDDEQMNTSQLASQYGVVPTGDEEMPVLDIDPESVSESFAGSIQLHPCKEM